jgi:hypothetical protein
VDLDSIYGPGTFTLAADLRALVVLTWRPDGDGLTARTLHRSEALHCLPLIRKDLGAFDPDQRGRAAAVREVLSYSRLFDSLTVVEVGGRTDARAIVPVVERLLAASP